MLLVYFTHKATAMMAATQIKVLPKIRQLTAVHVSRALEGLARAGGRAAATASFTAVLSLPIAPLSASGRGQRGEPPVYLFTPSNSTYFHLAIGVPTTRGSPLQG